MNFTLLGAVYFCICINILELCSGMQLSYLEMLLEGGTLPGPEREILSNAWK